MKVYRRRRALIPAGLRIALAVGVLIVATLLFVERAGAAANASEKARAAAPKCQKLIAGTTAKVARSRFKALDKCANAALTCIQVKKDTPKCLATAATTCKTALQSAANASIKARNKLTSAKSCTRDLPFLDVLAGDGLGFGALAPTCDASFSIDVCQGLGPLVDCLVRSHERAAGALYAQARPRAGELLGLLPQSVLPIDGLTVFPGCANCPGTEGKQLTKCGKRLTAATQKLVATIDSRFASCVQGVLRCQKAKDPNDVPGCLVDASNGCDDEAGSLGSAVGSFIDSIASGDCRSEAINFGNLAAQEGLNLDAIAGDCASLGVASPSDASAFASCLAERARCTASELVQQEVPRTIEFGIAGRLGALTADVTSSCPSATRSIGSARAGFFGSITKLLKTIRNGALVANGGPPRSSTGAPRTVTVNGPRRVAFGGLTKIPFTFRLSGARSPAQAPKLIVIAQGETPSSNYFEVPLPIPPTPDTEMTGVLEVTYQDVLPSCAFTLAFATSVGGVVSAYTPLMQVGDPAIAPVHTASLRLFNVDDKVEAILNGTSVLTAFFDGANPGVTGDVTSAFRCGENVLELQVSNLFGGGYTHAATLQVDNVPVVQSQCGRFLSAGCNFGDTTPGLVVDEFNYFCVPCNGTTCTRGTCADPYPLPALDRSFTARAVTAGTGQLKGSCGGAGPEGVFSLTPTTDGCFDIVACNADNDPGTSNISLYLRSGSCGGGETECTSDGCGYFFGSIKAGQTQAIVVDENLPLSAPAGVTLQIDRFPGSNCE